MNGDKITNNTKYNGVSNKVNRLRMKICKKAGNAIMKANKNRDRIVIEYVLLQLAHLIGKYPRIDK